jgi:serine protease Do
MKRMRNILVLTGLVWAVVGGVAMASEPDIRRDATVQAVEKALPSVVTIQTRSLVERRGFYEDLLRDFYGPFYRQRPVDEQYSLGSGVLIDEEGYVLTNLHVVQRANQIMVRLADGRVFEAEAIVGARFKDIALLKLKTKPGDTFTALKFAADDDLMLGETVLALGIPFGLGGSVSRGILSSKSRRPPQENEPLDVQDWLQTDAAINPGNSGGPLINLNAEVIGLNVAVYREGQGIGFAIPIKRVSEAISEMFTPEETAGLWFGARFRPGRLPLIITSVQARSPAAQAGLRAGDTVLALNEKPLHSYFGFIRELTNSGSQKAVDLTIQRGLERRQVKVTLVPESTYFNADLIRQKTGASLQALTPKLAESLGLVTKEGLVVAGVDPDSPAAAAGLKPQAVIQAIDDQPTPDVVTAAKLLSAKNRDDMVVFSVVIQRTAGRFVQVLPVEVKLKIR